LIDPRRLVSLSQVLTMTGKKFSYKPPQSFWQKFGMPLAMLVMIIRMAHHLSLVYTLSAFVLVVGPATSPPDTQDLEIDTSCTTRPYKPQSRSARIGRLSPAGLNYRRGD